jgi:hypothetical protein
MIIALCGRRPSGWDVVTKKSVEVYLWLPENDSLYTCIILLSLHYTRNNLHRIRWKWVWVAGLFYRLQFNYLFRFRHSICTSMSLWQEGDVGALLGLTTVCTWFDAGRWHIGARSGAGCATAFMRGIIIYCLKKKLCVVRIACDVQ